VQDNGPRGGEAGRAAGSALLALARCLHDPGMPELLCIPLELLRARPLPEFSRE
jgi:hypothetical protein